MQAHAEVSQLVSKLTITTDELTAMRAEKAQIEAHCEGLARSKAQMEALTSRIATLECSNEQAKMKIEQVIVCDQKGAIAVVHHVKTYPNGLMHKAWLWHAACAGHKGERATRVHSNSTGRQGRREH